MILREQACVERLQAYVTENGLSTNDGKMLDKWASGEKNLLITIYKDGRFRYSNDAKVMVMVPEMNEWEDTSWLYEVKFADGLPRQESAIMRSMDIMLPPACWEA